MPQIRYITSESQIGAPGVYVLEQAPAVPTRGQRRRNVLFVGTCVRGPVNEDVVCRSYQRFLDVFGGRDRATNGGAVMGQVWKALQGRSWGVFHVVRAAAHDATVATHTFSDSSPASCMTVSSSSVGSWGLDVSVKIMDAANGDPNYFNLAVKMYGKVTLYQNLTIQSPTLDNTGMVGMDAAELIKITTIANTRPVNTGYVSLSSGGSDGGLLDTDFTTSGGPIDTANKVRGVHALAVAGRSNTNIKTKIASLTINQKVWFVGADDETVIIDDAITERATFNTDKMTYWFNHVKAIDPITRTAWIEEPFLGPMSATSQTDPDVHVGDPDNAALYKFATGVIFQLGDEDRDALSAGGVSYMMQDLDPQGNTIIIPGDALTCSFTVNNADLDGRYMKDFILDAVATRLRGDQFKGNTAENRARRASSISGFLAQLARSGRYIQTDEETGKPQFSYKNNSSVNSTTDQANGLQREKLVCTLIPKNKEILLTAEIGVDAVVSETEQQ